MTMENKWGKSGLDRGSRTDRVLDVGKSWKYLRAREDNVGGKQRTRESGMR